MIHPILAGVETEYGLLIGDRGAEDQVDDAMEFVRACVGEHFVGWNYRYESPRSDLRGFRLDRLAQDPEDAKFDRGKTYGQPHDIRSDRVLRNGARFYNDHGHPEYSTPECLSLNELAIHDRAGHRVVRATADAYSSKTGRTAQVYKNNTDFHGASYGTHENYLVPRAIGFDRLFRDVTPMLIARQVLVGSGKVGSESGSACTFQLSQRADFFADSANAETLYRRPVFNTRDEPHAEAARFIRLHVICGDANMIAEATRRKVGLVKLALYLCEAGEVPVWSIPDPVRAFQAVSRDEKYEFPIALAGKSWTTAPEIMESYFSTAERLLELDDDMKWVIESSRALLEAIRADFETFARHVDWAAKRRMIEQYLESSGGDWRDPSLRSFDLEYHNIDESEGLHAALEEMGDVEPGPTSDECGVRLEKVLEPTRARARGVAVRRFRDRLLSACWRTITLEIDGQPVEIDLPPDAEYSAELEDVSDVGTFVEMLRGMK